jgi:hypothetical protein
MYDDDDDEARLWKTVSLVKGSDDEVTYKMMSSDEPPIGYPLAQPSAKNGVHRPQPPCQLVCDIRGEGQLTCGIRALRR